MSNAQRGKDGSLLENYCCQLGILLERRYSGLVLLEAKQQAERAATVANEAMLKARVADRAKSIFLANMAHELRTPLNAIIGFSEVIKLNNIQKRERYPEYAGYIHDAGTHLLNIINGILDLARIEAGKVELQEQQAERRHRNRDQGGDFEALHQPHRENHNLQGFRPPSAGIRGKRVRF